MSVIATQEKQTTQQASPHEGVDIDAMAEGLSIEEQARLFGKICGFLKEQTEEERQVLLQMHHEGRELMERDKAEEALEEHKNQESIKTSVDDLTWTLNQEQALKKPKFVKKSVYEAKKKVETETKIEKPIQTSLVKEDPDQKDLAEITVPLLTIENETEISERINAALIAVQVAYETEAPEPAAQLIVTPKPVITELAETKPTQEKSSPTANVIVIPSKEAPPDLTPPPQLEIVEKSLIDVYDDAENEVALPEVVETTEIVFEAPAKTTTKDTYQEVTVVAESVIFGNHADNLDIAPPVPEVTQPDTASIHTDDLNTPPELQPQEIIEEDALPIFEEFHIGMDLDPPADPMVVHQMLTDFEYQQLDTAELTAEINDETEPSPIEAIVPIVVVHEAIQQLDSQEFTQVTVVVKRIQEIINIPEEIEPQLKEALTTAVESIFTILELPQEPEKIQLIVEMLLNETISIDQLLYAKDQSDEGTHEILQDMTQFFTTTLHISEALHVLIGKLLVRRTSLTFNV